MTEPSPLSVVIIPVTPFQQNCSLIWCTRTMRGALVDAGGDIERLLGQVAKHGVTLEKLLVTHGHLDHCGATKELAERLELPIEGPQEADTFWIDQLDTSSAASYGMKPGKPFVPERWLHDDDTVTVGEVRLRVRHCPGHTPGHIVFVDESARIAFVGDVLFRGSVGRTDFPMGNTADLLRSIVTRLWPLGSDITFVPGHGPTSTFGEERRSNPYVADQVIQQGARGEL
jgi:glyoxylase-like metal-dependent hydrolase (beta-lactamase superfamily II)